MKKIRNFSDFDEIYNKNVVTEKWKNDVDIKSSGEHSGKTIEELNDELESLKKKSKKYQDSGKDVPKSIIEQEQEINFAIRAKRHWK